MAKPRNLKPQHQLAVDLWFGNGFNQRKALIGAGFSEKTAKGRPSAVFGRKDVQKYIEHKREKLQSKFEVTEENVLAELAKIAFSNMGDLIVVQEDGSAVIDFNLMTPEQRAAMSEYAVEQYMEGRGDGAVPVKKSKVKFHDKKGALELLGRKLGMFNDKLKIEGEVSVVERLQAGRNRLKQGEKK